MFPHFIEELLAAWTYLFSNPGEAQEAGEEGEEERREDEDRGDKDKN